MHNIELNGIPIYVGDSRALTRRIFYNHCRGNVEASVLRKYLATEMKFEFNIEKRESGSIRVRIKSPINGEEVISRYINLGIWRYVICKSYNEASDFQWYAIDIIKPLLNRKIKRWNHDNVNRYAFLLNRLVNQEPIKCKDIYKEREVLHKPGVYLFIHETTPKDFYLNTNIT